jgi:dTDP-4-dehydrorhamnose 3,5-epimerase
VNAVDMGKPGRPSAQVAGSEIEGVELRVANMHHDQRGCFTEVFQKHWTTVIDPCQWSAVESRATVFRGCHLHLRHDEYFCLLKGECSLGLRDERPGSASFGNWQLYHLFGESLAALTFPAGIIHGWYFHQPSLHIQAVSESYVSYSKDDNFGVQWSDPALEIPWPFSEPLLGTRAAGFGSLAALRERLAQVRG